MHIHHPYNPKAKPFFFVGLILAMSISVAHAYSDKAGWFYFNQGSVTTKVDSAKEYKDDHQPVGYDLLAVADAYYLQIGIDFLGKGFYNLFASFIDDEWQIADKDYGLDESIFNFKFGKFTDENANHSLGYGFDLDSRVNQYQEFENSSFTRKIRIGIGPNLSYRIQPHPSMVIFPNISGYIYPWPNKDYSFIPKSFDSYGYRIEIPVIIDVVQLFFPQSKKAFVLSAMPFWGAKSGFYNSNEMAGTSKNAESSTYGVKLGAYWALNIFTFMWK